MTNSKFSIEEDVKLHLIFLTHVSTCTVSSAAKPGGFSHIFEDLGKPQKNYFFSGGPPPPLELSGKIFLEFFSGFKQSSLFLVFRHYFFYKNVFPLPAVWYLETMYIYLWTEGKR